jgi:hyperosmotically inducible protein
MKLPMSLCVALLSAPALLTFACSRDNPNAATELTSATQPPADTTKLDERDKAGALTPTNQKNNADDLRTIQQIQSAIMSDDTLSSEAKDAKVSAADGVVTLRGPVKTDAERENLVSKALQFACPNRVDDQVAIQPTR